MKCVSMVTYSIKVNGAPTEMFTPERSLRQRDPLSPYFFLLCAEGFSTLLNKAETDGLIAGVKICHDVPSVSHLLFSDDSLILIRAKREDAMKLQSILNLFFLRTSILNLYEQCSGQVINKSKSAVLFSRNEHRYEKNEIKQLLEIQRETMNEKYLGLPDHVGRDRVQTFAYLKDRISKRIQGWKEKLLSWAGKEVFIKAVAQTIPTFAMGCFDLTKSLCDQISSMICRYWWNQQEGTHKVNWLSWGKMIMQKSEGGLWFRDMHSFNIATLAKQGWRILQNPDSQCASILKAKYFWDTNCLKAQPKRRSSYMQRCILKGIEVLKKGLVWHIGNGDGIKIWSDPWLTRGDTRAPITPRGRNIVQQVFELINPVTSDWDVELVKATFWEEDVKTILAIHVHMGRENVLAWHPEPRGLFTVKSAYKTHKRDIMYNQQRSLGAASTSQGRIADDDIWR
jgi:hypothetical protein